MRRYALYRVPVLVFYVFILLYSMGAPVGGWVCYLFVYVNKKMKNNANIS